MHRGLKWISRLLTRLSALGLILTCCLWFRSYLANDHVEYARDNPLTVGHLWSSRGQLAIARTHRWPTPHCEAWYEGREYWMLRHPAEVPDAELTGQMRRAWHGFGLYRDHHTATGRKESDADPSDGDQSESGHATLSAWDPQYWNRRANMLALPHWAVVLVLSILPALAAYRTGRTGLWPSFSWNRQRVGQFLLSAAAALSLFLMLIMLTGWISQAWDHRRFSIESWSSYVDPTRGNREGIHWQLDLEPDGIDIVYVGPAFGFPGWRMDDQSFSVRRERPNTSVAIVTQPFPAHAWDGKFDHYEEFGFPGLYADYVRLGTFYCVQVSPSYWILLLPLSFFPALWLLSWRRRQGRARRAARGLCAQCGYDLRASPERCPECGAAVAVPAQVNELPLKPV